MPTYTRNASQVPTPIAPPTATLGTPSTPFTTGQNYPPPGTSALFNQGMAAMKQVCAYGAGGYGIFSGCALSSAGGLNVQMAVGVVIGEGVIEFVASGAVGAAPFYQKNVPSAYGLADNTDNYVWLTQTGTLIASTGLTYPSQAKWFLGTVTTSGGAITTIDASGVMYVYQNRFERRTADAGAPTDSPPSATTFFTQTAGGKYFWVGNGYYAMQATTVDSMILRGPLDCSANPNYPAADAGDWYRISVGGKVGGGSGSTVEAGDLILCVTDGTASGTQAGVGANWIVLRLNYANLLKRDGTNSPSADIPWGSHKITGLADPTLAQDAATKAYVDAAAVGLDWKPSCRVATTANITLSGTQTIDGVACVAGDRVLVKNQTTGANNGIYVVAAGAWSRSTDSDTSAEMTSGVTVWISEGSTNINRQFTLTTADPITLGSTSLTFTQTGGSGLYTASTGLTLTGSAFSIDGTANILGGDLSGSIGTATVAKINGVAYNGDPLTQYTKLTGRSGGQTTQGGTASGDSYTIQSTAHATKGFTYIGSTTLFSFDEVNGRLGIGTATPSAALHISQSYSTNANGIQNLNTFTTASASTCLGMNNPVFCTNTSGSFSNVYAHQLSVQANGSGGTIASARGAYCFFTAATGGTITNCYNFFADPANGAGTVGTQYGFYCETLAKASTNWAFYAHTNDSWFGGDVHIGTAGKGLKIKEGSNARMGNSTLVGGTVVVSNTSVTANSRIFLSRATTGGTPGHLSYVKSAGTSFTINSSSGTDTSTIDWIILEPAP